MSASMPGVLRVRRYGLLRMCQVVNTCRDSHCAAHFLHIKTFPDIRSNVASMKGKTKKLCNCKIRTDMDIILLLLGAWWLSGVLGCRKRKPKKRSKSIWKPDLDVFDWEQHQKSNRR